MVGFWKGGYSGAMPYAMLFRNNGTVRVYANNADTAAADKAEVTYTVSGTTVNSTYTYLVPVTKVSTTATANAAFTSMTGTWGNGTATSGGGTITLTKQ